MHGYPLEVRGYPEFYKIPGFQNYAISPDGSVINKITGKFLAGSTNPAGYVNYRLLSDVGAYSNHRPTQACRTSI